MVVVKDPSDPVVTTTTPESVSIAPSASVVVQVEVYVLKGGSITEVVVSKAPSLFVVTMTTPESVSTPPLEFVEVQVVV